MESFHCVLYSDWSSLSFHNLYLVFVQNRKTLLKSILIENEAGFQRQGIFFLLVLRPGDI